MGTRHASAWDSAGFLMWHATLRWQRTMRACLQPLGLTHVQFVLLASAWWLGREAPPSQRALADHCGTDVMMTSQVVRSLERSGLVRREVDPLDARARRVVVTPDGAQLAARALGEVERADDAFFHGVADEDFVARMKRLADAPTTPPAAAPPRPE